jgi:hypothetical protein
MGKMNMPSKQIIYAREDVQRLVHFADSIGLLLLPVELGYENDVRPRKPYEVTPFSGGTLLFYRQEWVDGAIDVRRTQSGFLTGTYSVSKGVNLSAIGIYVSGDADENGTRRLGDGEFGFKRDYLAEPAHEMRPSPPDVEVVYKQLCKHLLSTITVRGGAHRYHVCKEAATLAARMPTRPLFDYIPWPPPDLHKATGRRKK